MMKISMMVTSSHMLFSNNQMAMVIMIMCTCCLLSSLMYLFSNIHWFSVLILLIYISGVMVLFMFVVSLSPNEKTLLKFNKKKTVIFLAASIMTMKMAQNSENLKIFSSIECSMSLFLMTILIILMMAYLPPKIISSFYKGMKSTK